MSKELIERLRLMSADTYGNDAADALESLEADRDSWERQAGDRLDDVLRVVAERDALANRVYQLEQKNSGAAEIIAAMQETHAEDQAELKALREQEPFDASDARFRDAFDAVIRYGKWPSARNGDGYRSPVTQIAWQASFHTINRLALYARPVPARYITNEAIEEMAEDFLSTDGDEAPLVVGYVEFARAIEAALMGEGK